MKLFPMLGATILLGALSTNAWSRIGVSDGNNCILSTQNITVVSPCSNPETTCGTNEDGSLYRATAYKDSLKQQVKRYS